MISLTTNFNQFVMFAIRDCNFINVFFIKTTEEATEEKTEEGRRDVLFRMRLL